MHLDPQGKSIATDIQLGESWYPHWNHSLDTFRNADTPSPSVHIKYPPEKPEESAVGFLHFESHDISCAWFIESIRV